MIQLAIAESDLIERDLDEDDRITPDAVRDVILVAVEHATHARTRQRVDAMLFLREQFDEVELLARIASPESQIDFQRQGFVLLMTAFDAAVFDLARIAFRQKFFEIVGTFGKQERISLEDIGRCGSFEAFRDGVIEEQLKRRYIKDLLGLLQSLGVELVDSSRGDQFVQLVELVLRRNLHVHGRGIVDRRYLEAEPLTAKPKYNLFDLKLGDRAIIDDDYFQNSIRLCVNCVERLARWIAA